MQKINSMYKMSNYSKHYPCQEAPCVHFSADVNVRGRFYGVCVSTVPLVCNVSTLQ